MEKLINNKHKFTFSGVGSELFKIMFLNWILTFLSIGIYYPWAKEKYLKYLYSNSNIDNDQFRFHGTGKEMFIGMLKAIVLLLIFSAVIYLLLLSGELVSVVIFFYLSIFLIIPIAVHGSYRYRFSRSSWRNIRFRYIGNKATLILLFLKSVFLIFITFGIYTSWFKCNLRRYLFNNMYLGNAKFNYIGKGDELFLINFKGVIFTFLTFGIYSFWWKKDKFNYYVDNIQIINDGKVSKLNSKLDAGEVFEILIINFLLTFFTLGIAYPWVITRSLNKLYSYVTLDGEANLDNLIQNSESFNDAAGDDIADFLDIDFFI